MSENRMFETERLYARHFTPGDLDDFAALCAEPRVMTYVDDGETLPRQEVERWIEVCQRKYAERGYGTSAVFERATDRFVGFCGVIRAPGHAFDEIIYVYHVDTWGKGYATEAGRAMIDYVFAHTASAHPELDRIYATIHPDNASSINVVQKIGFELEKKVDNDDGSTTNYYVIERPV